MCTANCFAIGSTGALGQIGLVFSMKMLDVIIELFKDAE
jgi:hypothetical protein